MTDAKDMVAAVPPSRTPEQSPAALAGGDARAVSRPVAGVRRLLIGAGVVAAVALLFLAYLQVSRTYPENSDESNDLLMAWDIGHGNLLLHGWFSVRRLVHHHGAASSTRCWSGCSACTPAPRMWPRQ